MALDHGIPANQAWSPTNGREDVFVFVGGNTLHDVHLAACLAEGGAGKTVPQHDCTVTDGSQGCVSRPKS